MAENLLLAVLPEEERARLRPFLKSVTLDLKQTVIEPDEPISHVYFPYNFVTSTLQEMSDGTMIEVGLMGVEGMVGIQLWLRQKTVPSRTIVQGSGLAMTSEDFIREVMRKETPLNDLDRF